MWKKQITLAGAALSACLCATGMPAADLIGAKPRPEVSLTLIPPSPVTDQITAGYPRRGVESRRSGGEASARHLSGRGNRREAAA